jgi:hypothetical protein
MLKTHRIVLITLALAVIAGPAMADSWLHVRVEDRGPDGEQVEVNIPLTVVEAVLPSITIDDLHKGHFDLDDLDLGDADLDGLDLRAILTELRDSPDMNFVTVRSDDESVRVAKEGDYLIVRVEERSANDTENVRVTIPLKVVEALIQNDDNDLDLIAGLRALSEFEGEDLVRVESDDETIRVWIDSSESGS